MFDPNLPLANSEMRSAEMRDQFNGLRDLIVPETDPVFAASEAALLVAGDKAKIDGALPVQLGVPGVGEIIMWDAPFSRWRNWPLYLMETDPVFAASEAAQLVAGDKAKLDAALQPGQPVSALANDAGYTTDAYVPAQAGHWDSSPPAT